MEHTNQHADAAAAFGEPPSRRPSTAGFWIGGLLGVVAVAGAILWLVLGLVGFSDAVDGLQRVPVPGQRVLDLRRGQHAVYYESGVGEKARIPSLQIVLRPAGGGAPVEVGPYSGTVTYSFGGHAGQSLAGFGIRKAGRYAVSIRAPSGAPSGAVLAVGRGLGGRLVRAIVGAIVIFFGGVFVAGGIIALTSARRQRSAS